MWLWLTQDSPRKLPLVSASRRARSKRWRFLASPSRTFRSSLNSPRENWWLSCWAKLCIRAMRFSALERRKRHHGGDGVLPLLSQRVSAPHSCRISLCSRLIRSLLMLLRRLFLPLLTLFLLLLALWTVLDPSATFLLRRLRYFFLPRLLGLPPLALGDPPVLGCPQREVLRRSLKRMLLYCVSLGRAIYMVWWAVSKV